MSKRKMTTRRHMAAALSLSLLLGGYAGIEAQADVLDDAKEKLGEATQQVGTFLDDIGVGPVLKNGYDTVTDFIFTYETQPDDDEMENLARSWAVTAWLADEDRVETNYYYFDNHTLSMVKDLTQIPRGYNLKKTPEGSSLNGKHTGILKAVVKDATNYTVEWVNYDDEVNFYLLQKLQSNNSESEAETDIAQAAAVGDAAGAVGNAEAALAGNTDTSSAGDAEAALTDTTTGVVDAAATVGNADAAATDTATDGATAVAGGTATDNTTAVAGGTAGTVTSVAGGTAGTVTSVAGGTAGTVTSVAGGTAGTVTSVAGGGAGTVTSVAGGTAGTVTSVAGGGASTVTSVAGGTAGTVTSVAGGTEGNVTAVGGETTTDSATAVAGETATDNVTTVDG